MQERIRPMPVTTVSPQKVNPGKVINLKAQNYIQCVNQCEARGCHEWPTSKCHIYESTWQRGHMRDKRVAPKGNALLFPEICLLPPALLEIHHSEKHECEYHAASTDENSHFVTEH